MQGIMRKILRDNWGKFTHKFSNDPMLDTASEFVEDMLACQDPKNGYIEYMCVFCGESKYVPFTCKSKLCPTCGKRYADKWAENLSHRLLNVPHRYIVFTIHNSLWPFFSKDKKRLSILYQASAETMTRIMTYYNKDKAWKKLTPGIVTVIHSYGKDLKQNPHVNMIVTEGGIDENGNWVSSNFWPFDKLRKTWKIQVIDRLRKVLPKGKETDQFLMELYHIEWYVYAPKKNRIKGNAKEIATYIARYVMHPPIAESRICSYNGKEVGFYYRDDTEPQKVKLVKKDVFVFISLLISHIMPDNFKLIRYYGLYTSPQKELKQMLLDEFGNLNSQSRRKMGWRDCIIKTYGYDPLICKKCGREMLLVRLAYKRRSEIYSYFKVLSHEIEDFSYVFNKGYEWSQRTYIPLSP